jgi:hypothetical protein
MLEKPDCLFGSGRGEEREEGEGEGTVKSLAQRYSSKVGSIHFPCI